MRTVRRVQNAQKKKIKRNTNEKQSKKLIKNISEKSENPLQWHPAFFSDMQIELKEDAENL